MGNQNQGDCQLWNSGQSAAFLGAAFLGTAYALRILCGGDSEEYASL
jgi:hypothetical protein